MTSTEIHWITRCAPEFVEKIQAIADKGGKTPDEVYWLWRKYSRECDSADQSALIWEFVNWYQRDLGLSATDAAYCRTL